MEIKDTVFLWDTFTLTAGDHTSSPQRVEDAYQLMLDMSYTQGAAESGNTLDVEVYFANPTGHDSPATADWVHEVSESVVAGASNPSPIVRTLQSGESMQFLFPCTGKWVRVKITENGVSSNRGVVTAKLVLGMDVD